ncbi:MAG TPA: hypothetical protein VJ208_00600 [Candidatus Nanoarchaeia archaeon]|nr:hypothetical protein [Candidatus Nanoarchaeia archaeon]
MELEQGDLVLCTVERIEKTIVFVKVLVGNEEIDGSIITSEIAPGRIRNIRDYVVPKKRIVCKVLRISQNKNIELSLRRVTPKEAKEVTGRYEQEKAYLNILKKVFGDKADEIIKKIQNEGAVLDFFQNAEENQKKFEKILGKDYEKILGILKTQRQKKILLKKEIILKSALPNGIQLIKEVLDRNDAEIKYITAGRYSIKVESDKIKKADAKLKEILAEIEKRAKGKGMEFSVREK